jgi:simple sugar transport system ATP-binding protein
MVKVGLVLRDAVRRFAEDCIRRFDVRTGGPESAARSLSGGNLQKFIVGREILLKPKVLVVAQPTWGVDVGAGGLLRLSAVRALAQRLIERFQVKAGGPGAAAKSLSGGNLQKFIVGREIDANPKLLIVSQPTWGVDVGAAAQIRGALLKLRDEGCAILVVSEELDELFEISDRLLVIAQGRLSPSVPTAKATIEMIGEWMSGLWPGAARTEAAHA